VITVVAVAFLALTQRERTSVSQSSQQTEAELMGDIAFERAKGAILAQILATTNLNAVDLMVSRNFINTNGFDRNLGSYLTNVNYDYLVSGGAPTLNDVQQTIANLFYDPRPPVFINTNFPGGPEILDFRFYVDLNRNARYDTNGWSGWIEWDGNRYVAVTNAWLTGDPEWIGVLENPDFPHSRSNQFVGRYAFIALPIGRSLDVNSIHNHAKNPSDLTQNWYYRNQGYGSWELNLAAFLVDLNTNYWTPPGPSPFAYRYDTSRPVPSSGIAFNDAREILNARFIQPLLGANLILPGLNVPGPGPFRTDGIDNYANGPLDVFGSGTFSADDTALPTWQANFEDNPGTPWPGAYNPTNFYTPHDFFDGFLPGSPFTNALRQAGNREDSYNRYTFYRMLAQMSMASGAELPRVQINELQRKVGARLPHEFVAEPLGKININYDNTFQPSSDMVTWDANKFFNVVGDVLLNAQFPGLRITNIVVTNYNPIIHRLLQVAANIYDSTVSNRFPSVFRPRVVQAPSGQLLINGYYQDEQLSTLNTYLAQNPYGLPFVVGAKKGFPNFNEYVMETAVMAARKLEFVRLATNQPPNQTNEMYIIGISNFFGLEAWNSYSNVFRGPLDMQVVSRVSMTLSNATYQPPLRTIDQTFTVTTNLTDWRGYQGFENQNSRFSFLVPLYTNLILLPDSVFRFPNSLDPISQTNRFIRGSAYEIPDWRLSISNGLTFVMSTSGRIIDYVQLANLTNHFSVTRTLMGGKPQPTSVANDDLIASCWNTNRSGGGNNNLTPTEGMLNQIAISLDNPPLDISYWRDFGYDYQRATGQDRDKDVLAFKQFMFPNSYTNQTNSNLSMQAPFTAARKFVVSASLQVNDPLVHHMFQHLVGLTNFWGTNFVRPTTGEMSTNRNLGLLNARYKPWRGGGGRELGAQDNNLGVKDPGITRSDDWEFPTNKFASIGWLGRVHRGTPWQTIYLKSQAATDTEWNNHFFDRGLFAHPTNDWRLIDVFTTAIHPNASHGQLSINQTNLAAWSAVLGGVLVLTNFPPEGEPVTNHFEPLAVEPNSEALRIIYEGIQKVRDQMKGPNGDLAATFRRLGDILMVPELTVQSPFINRLDDMFPAYGITDVVMERIPQQILSLLKVGDPRFVVYGFGQSLRPAERSILTSGPYLGMCTNYQITGEAVTRTVLQIRGTAGTNDPPRPVIEAFNILRAD
jgi:hypothetical protein